MPWALAHGASPPGRAPTSVGVLPVEREPANRLKADGLRVWLDEWEIKPGDLIGLKIEQGLERSRTLILVMSANAFASEWVSLERHTALFRDPTNNQRRFVPLRLDDAQIPDLLRQFAYVDWRARSDPAYADLQLACRPSSLAPSPVRRRRVTQRDHQILRGHRNEVNCVAVTADGRRAVSGASDNTMRVWDLEAGRYLATLEGHTGMVIGVAVTADGRRAVSGAADKTVRVWDLEAGRCLATLEGHTAMVYGVAVTADGRRAVSGAGDDTVRVWDLEAGRCLATLEGHTGTVYGVAVTADGRRAVSGASDKTVRVWDLPSRDVSPSSTIPVIRYTNAKVLLVGDSGVGKSGLALRLTENRFEPTVSTDGAWATQLPLSTGETPGEIEREIWLWDFAGQADYRLIHQLFMDETALAVQVFNPQSENPFDGLGQWERDLTRAARRPFRKLLVAGRCDRGGLMVSRSSLDEFRQQRNFAGYFETSALLGTGCAELRQAIVESIDWDNVPWTASPRIFKLLKDAIIKLKDEGTVLLRLVELKQRLELRLPGESFTIDELTAVIGLLAGPGVVWRLGFGDYVLLQPERINAYAAAVVRSVRKHIDEIGCILEDDVLAGKLDYQDLQRLPPEEERVVLRAMHQTFVERGMCLREHSQQGTLLVFPSYFQRERPELADHPASLVSYRFSGSADEIWATLVVRLHHTPTFDKDQLWRYAADFRTQAGRRVGLMMTKLAEGEAAISVYCEPAIPDETKVTFIRYVHDHLQARATEPIRTRHYVCPHCGTPVQNHETVSRRLERGDQDIACVDCERRIPLVDLIEQKFTSDELRQRTRELEEQAQASIDNESRELILVGHAFAIAGEAGQIFRPTSNSDWGLDGEIEFKNDHGQASGRRLYLQLKSGDSYIYRRRKDGKDIFRIKEPRHAEYWQAHQYPVMLVVRTSNGEIRWLNVSDYLRRQKRPTRQIVFDGEPFTALNLRRLRDQVLGHQP